MDTAPVCRLTLFEVHIRIRYPVGWTPSLLLMSATVSACRLVVCVAVCASLGSCSESSLALPTAPSSLSVDKVGELTIVCPVDITVQSQDGQSVALPFSPPIVKGGQAPVISSCSPPSGEMFSIGTTETRCTASDALGQAANCVFTSTVLSPAMLAVTKFMAFGDSLTAGVTSLPIVTISQLEPTESYPFKLESKLSQAYQAREIVVANSGLPGERASEGLGRFQTELALKQPEVVLIMEGTNDLNQPLPVPSAASAAVESMILAARAAGVDPVVATIPPARAISGHETLATLVVQYNDLIRAVAARHSAPLVDIFSIVENGVCPTRSSTLPSLLPDIRTVHQSIPCIGDDHIHITAEGYELVADAFFDLIVETYHVPQSLGVVRASPTGEMFARRGLGVESVQGR